MSIIETLAPLLAAAGITFLISLLFFTSRAKYTVASSSSSFAKILSAPLLITILLTSMTFVGTLTLQNRHQNSIVVRYSEKNGLEEPNIGIPEASAPEVPSESHPAPEVTSPTPTSPPTPTPAPTPTPEGLLLKIYDESNSPLNDMYWGILRPNEEKTYRIILSNEGTLPFELHLRTETWNPASASQYITLTWDREGQVITSNTQLISELRLSVSPQITAISGFTVDIIITVTQV